MNRTLATALALLLLTTLVAAEEMSFTANEWTLKVDADGRITSLADHTGYQLVQPGMRTESAGITVVGGSGPRDTIGNQELHRLPNGMLLTRRYQDLPLSIEYRIEFTGSQRLVVLKRTVKLIPIETITSDVMVRIGNNLAPANSGRKIFVPRQNGTGEELAPSRHRNYIWRLNGGPDWPQLKPEMLAIPMLSDSTPSGLRITHIADPWFTTHFAFADIAPRSGSILPEPMPALFWEYTGTKVPLTDPVERTFWTVIHSGGPEEAMKAWYATALADTPPGPDWLHGVAWQHYDYLSHGGKGWFEDIDAVEKLVPREDRNKIVFTLHGWYDLVGRYTLNPATGKLEDEWTAFPSAPAVKANFPTSESVKMSKAEMHRRIKYAKDRGFRVCVYFGDGMAACDGAKDIFSPDEVLTWGGWQGPDTAGKTYIQNPAHPKVYARYLKYLEALLDEYGGEIDVLVWDETFTVRAGAISGGEKPAYASAAMMRLVRDCTKLVSRKRPGVAFLASDDVGLTSDGGKTFWTDIPPYAIMAHGCYQDSHSRPQVWPWGIFPNYRNVLWSCNWQAVTRFDYTAFGVKHYQTPVATSNGWLDDKGIARLTLEQRNAVIALFNGRKGQRQELKWLTDRPPEFTP